MYLLFTNPGFTWLFGLLTILIPPDPEEDWLYTVERTLVFLYVIFNGLQVGINCWGKSV